MICHDPPGFVRTPQDLDVPSKMCMDRLLDPSGLLQSEILKKMFLRKCLFTYKIICNLIGCNRLTLITCMIVNMLRICRHNKSKNLQLRVPVRNDSVCMETLNIDLISETFVYFLGNTMFDF